MTFIIGMPQFISCITGALQFIACIYVLFRGIAALNHMSGTTSHSIRYAYVMMTGGASFGALTANQPNLTGMLIAAGVALFMFGDRRNAAIYAVR